MMVFMSLVLVVIGPFCCDIGWSGRLGRVSLLVSCCSVVLSIRLLFVRLRLMSSISRLYGAGNCWHLLRGSCSKFVYQLSSVIRW